MKLLDIPIYRLLIEPESFLPENCQGKSWETMLNELPNALGVNRENELRFLSNENVEKYYLNQLLIEGRIFCREMLTNIQRMDQDNSRVLVAAQFEQVFGIIKKYQVDFLKFILNKHINDFKLKVGKVLEEINQADNIELIQKILRTYTIVSKLCQHLKKELKYL